MLLALALVIIRTSAVGDVSCHTTFLYSAPPLLTTPPPNPPELVFLVHVLYESQLGAAGCFMLEGEDS